MSLQTFPRGTYQVDPILRSKENLYMAEKATSPAGFFLESALPFDLSAIFCPETAFFELDSVSPLSAFFGCYQTEKERYNYFSDPKATFCEECFKDDQKRSCQFIILASLCGSTIVALKLSCIKQTVGRLDLKSDMLNSIV